MLFSSLILSSALALQSPQAIPEPLYPPTATVTITAVGDCTLGNDTKMESATCFNATYKQYGSEYFLSNFKELFQQDDLTIANLECVLSTQGSRLANKDWCFRSDPSYLDILTSSSVEAVSFANNHCHDYGDISYTDTMKYLEERGIYYSSEELTCVTDINGIPVGMISIQAAYRTGDTKADKEYYDTQFLKDLTKACIDDVKEKGAKLILVNYHWGIEATYKISAQQEALGHYAVDEGANLVIGHHPHRVQPVEYYNGSYIIYSLGNFCFGGNSNPKDKDSFAWRQTFAFVNGELLPEAPAILIPASISSVSTRNDFRPTPSFGSERSRIMTKMNDLSKPYGVTFSDMSGFVAHSTN